MTLSQAALSSLMAQETGEVWIVLLTIDHPDLVEPARVSSDAVDTPSRGEIYRAVPFEFTMPDHSDTRPPESRLRISNIGRELVSVIRSIIEPATVTAELVLASDPDQVEIGPLDMILKSVDYDALVIEGHLGYEDILSEPFPGDSITPDKFPALFT